jgi:ankyrin repeat protein
MQNSQVTRSVIQSKDELHIKTANTKSLLDSIKYDPQDIFLENLLKYEPKDILVNITDQSGNRLITIAVIKNYIDVVNTLVTKYKARMDILDQDGSNILRHPIRFSYSKMLDLMIELNKKTIGIDLINIRDSQGAIPLHYAIFYNNIYALKVLLENGGDVEYANKNGSNALHLSIYKRNIEMIKMILAYTKNINSRTTAGLTSLHFAVRHDLIEIVKILLARGADPNLTEYDNKFNPLFMAVIENKFEISKLLIDAGTDINHQDWNCRTVAHYAIEQSFDQILDYIFTKYAVILQQNFDVYTENTNESRLINRLDVNAVDIDGVTLCHEMLYAYRNFYKRYIEMILPETNVNYQDNAGRTILHLMVEFNTWQDFKSILSKKKLSIFIKNAVGVSVYDLVYVSDRTQFLNMVIDSYYFNLRRDNKIWADAWQNSCKLAQKTEAECLNIIRKTILKEKSSFPISINKKPIVIEKSTKVEFSTFVGSQLDVICGFKYLILKHKDAASLFNDDNDTTELTNYHRSIGAQEEEHQNVMQFEIRWTYQNIFFPDLFENLIISHIKSGKVKYIVMPIGITLAIANHSNSLIYDIERKILERFEPHGSDYPTQFNYNPELLDKILKDRFRNILEKIYGPDVEFTYLRPKDYLPRIGFQILDNSEVHYSKNIGDPNGFCTLWSSWYLDYRLAYSTYEPRVLVKQLIRNIKINNEGFRNLIRDYSGHVTNLRDSYLKKMDLNVNDYLNNKMSQRQLKQLRHIILTDR